MYCESRAKWTPASRQKMASAAESLVDLFAKMLVQCALCLNLLTHFHPLFQLDYISGVK